MNNEIDELEEGFEEDFLDDLFDEELNEMIKVAAKSANKLTALIVENNRHNSVKMTEEDIYRIFNNSFNVAMEVISPISIE